MVEIPEHLLIRSAEARAKALGITVEQALAEMKGESAPTVVEKNLKLKSLMKNQLNQLSQKNQLNQLSQRNQLNQL